jgi:two-component system, LytTR family, sensor kinase
VVAVAVAVKLYQLRMNSVVNEKNLIREKLKAEILHLKAQINPHFLFNTLNSIYAMARSKSEQTSQAIVQLSHILRYILYEAGSKTVLLADEMKIIQDYITLQKLRFGNRIQLNFHYQLHDERCMIAPLLLLPLVENAFKHSNDPEAKIDMEIRTTKEGLFVRSSNPVVEESVKTQAAQGGIGLANIRRQLELLYTRFKLEHTKINGIFTLNLYVDLDSYANPEMFDTRR